MKKRILTGLIGGALLFVVLLLLPPIFLTIALSGVCGLAMYEVLIVSRFVGHRGLTVSAVFYIAAGDHACHCSDFPVYSVPIHCTD